MQNEITPQAFFDVVRRARQNGLGTHCPLQRICALVLLGSRQQLSISAVAKELGTSSASITGIADSLEKAELIQRTAANHDRRVVMLSLTSHGRKVLARIFPPANLPA